VSEAGRRSVELDSYVGKEIIAGIRPEHMEDARLEEAAALSSAQESVLEVEAQVIESMGREKYVYFELPKEQVARPRSEERTDTGTTGKAGGGSADELAATMVARVSGESRAHRGDKMRLAIDASKIHLFDRESEEMML
jgi:multiple sugar transport system ATP-binding protein